ncbi:MAG TPA: hypothetical protein VMH87_17375, partial [Pseudomonadales bacterium]|nr:hypothetical protein [Pseudomonadales bacterium]
VAPDTSSAMVVTNFPTTNSTAKFYWVDGGSNLTVQCSATINGATVTGQAVLTVVRPMAKITDQTSAVRMGYDENDISYGVYFGTFGSPPGILFSNVITLPQGNYNYGNTSYTSQWVQVIIPVYTGTITISSTNVYTVLLATTNVVLDTQYPYGFNANYPFPDTDDSPGVQTASPNEIAASFSQKSEMWLMFQPANGQWVPLRKVSWNAAGAATNAGAGWILTGSSWSTNPPDADTGTAFPTWTNNISDIQLLTNYIGNL